MLQACWCCRDQQRACKMAQASAEKLEHTGPTEKKGVASVPQREELANTPSAFAKRNRAVCPDHQIMRWARAVPWRDRGDQSGGMGRKGWTP